MPKPVYDVVMTTGDGLFEPRVPMPWWEPMEADDRDKKFDFEGKYRLNSRLKFQRVDDAPTTATTMNFLV